MDSSCVVAELKSHGHLIVDTKKAKSSSSRVVLDETGPHHPKSLYHELVFKNFSL